MFRMEKSQRPMSGLMNRGLPIHMALRDNLVVVAVKPPFEKLKSVKTKVSDDLGQTEFTFNVTNSLLQLCICIFFYKLIYLCVIF